MSLVYSLAYLRGLAVTRLCVDYDGVIVLAEGYDGNLRKWTYRHDYLDWDVGWVYQPDPKPSWLRRLWNKLTRS